MLNLLLDFMSALPGAHYAPRERIQKAAVAIVYVATDPNVEPLPIGDTREEREKNTAYLLATWSFFEAAWRVDAIGDAGRSCGVMQTQNVQKWVKGATCQKVRANLVLGYRVGLAIIRYSIEKCRTKDGVVDIEAALGLYATGEQCGYARALVQRRCTIAKVKCR